MGNDSTRKPLLKRHQCGKCGVREKTPFNDHLCT